MLNNHAYVQSKFDITKKSPTPEFKLEINQVFHKYLDINNKTTPTQQKFVNNTLQKAELQLAKDTAKYGKTFGEITRVLLFDVLLEGFGLPGFDLQQFKKYLEGVKAGKNVAYTYFQRIFDGSRKISRKYMNQLWEIERSGFDFNKIQPIVVWYDKKRKKFIILDGGHTLIMCLLHGMSYAKYVIVVFAKTIEEAVAVYTDQYKCTTRLEPAQLTIGDFVKGDESARAVMFKIFDERYNLDGFIEDDDAPTVRCLTLLRSIYNEYGQTGLNFVFDMPKLIWGDRDKKVTDKSIIMVLSQVFEACSQSKDSFDSIYEAMAACDSAQEFMDDARKFILDGNYKSIGGKTNEGPITTYCKYKAGMIKLVKKN